MYAQYRHGENDGYDPVLHKISRYDTVPKRSAVFNNCMLLFTVYVEVGPHSTVRD